MNSTGYGSRLAIAAALWCMGGLALAQVAPTLPGQVSPVLQREQLEQQQRQREMEERARQVQVPALRGEAIETQALPDQDVVFVLQRIRFSSSAFLQAPELEELARPYLGRELRFADLNGLLAQINALYEQAGQLTARAIIPPQAIEDGELRVVLVEAKVDEVDWQGRQWVDPAFYDRRIRLEQGQMLDSPQLMADIQRFNATSPGPQVSAGLSPGRTFGTSRVTLQAHEPARLQWLAFANNYGNQGSGREQLGGSLTWFSPSGAADSLTALVVGTSDSTFGSLRYARPVNRHNGMAWVEAGANTMKITEGPYADLDIEGDSQVYSAGYEHPWWLGPKWLLRAGTGYQRQAAETTVEGLPLSDTDIGEFFVTGTAEYRGAPWYARYDQRVRRASADNDISGESGGYTLLNGTGMLQRAIGDLYAVNGRLAWQYASDPGKLPASLYFQLGGIASVRGYDPGVISAPRGVAANLEFSRRFGERWQAFVFYDYGLATELGTRDVDLQGAGVGLNLDWNRHFSASLVAANALNDVVPDQDNNQVLLQIILR
ncbi:ShlB/FhaC/HecB family hemolysin secretion/activation protein [Pseudoxanthomonas suwonensis]|uniref:ShlB/FhaC/HecB family hemolysin secretion/activation protein n=1 Tax=Pseudoxanthomonas suwonensis TaxID=314722 RepID=UPI0011860EDC|nr:POTRA domain-containing protein [Pseudoxanthomonas suwonensis]